MVLVTAIVLYETQIGANDKGTLILKAARSIIALLLSHKTETIRALIYIPEVQQLYDWRCQLLMSCWSAEDKKILPICSMCKRKKRFLFLGVVKLAWYHTIMLMHTHTRTHVQRTNMHALPCNVYNKRKSKQSSDGWLSTISWQVSDALCVERGEHTHAKSRQLRRNLEHVRHTCQEANRYTGACSAYIQIWPLIHPI